LARADPTALLGLWYHVIESPHGRKAPLPVPLADFGSWTAARFQSQEARDRFLCGVAALQRSAVDVKSMPDEGRGALVRWRPGQFLGLNDVAYAHGGRIILTATRRRVRLL
jgi:hypothetical protein